MKNYYSVLGLDSSADEEEIKKAYRKLSVKMHPDKNEGDDFFEEFFKKINEAYYILGNRKRKKEYDALFNAEKSKKEPLKKATDVSRKSDIIDNSSLGWKQVKKWRRLKNSFLALNIFILLFALAPRIGTELQGEKKSEIEVMYGTISTVNGLNLRILPSLYANVVTKIPANSSVEILEISDRSLVIDGVDGNWLKIKYGSNEGWVWGGYVELLKNEELAVKDKPEIKSKKKTYKNTFFQRDEYYGEDEVDLKENDFVDVEEISIVKKPKMSSNSFGNDANEGHGGGREDDEIGRQTRLNDVNLNGLVIEEDAIVCFKLSVNSEGRIEKAVKDEERTTTSNSWLISEIRKRVLSEVRYSKSMGRRLEIFSYSVKVSAD